MPAEPLGGSLVSGEELLGWVCSSGKEGAAAHLIAARGQDMRAKQPPQQRRNVTQRWQSPINGKIIAITGTCKELELAAGKAETRGVLLATGKCVDALSWKLILRKKILVVLPRIFRCHFFCAADQSSADTCAGALCLCSLCFWNRCGLNSWLQ